MFGVASKVRKHSDKSKMWDVLKAIGLGPSKKFMSFKAKKMEVV